MTVALVLDFPGGTKQEYDAVVDRMQLGGRMAPGGLVHAAGSYDGGWRVIEVDEDKGGSGERPVLVQCVILPGLDRAAFAAADDEVVAEGMPGEITFHVNGPLDDGWCVVDGWSSKEARDRFAKSRIEPALRDAPLQGPPRTEDLVVQVTMPAGAPAHA